MKTILHHAGLKATPARGLLLRVLQDRAKPLTISQLLAIETIASSMNKTTIYRSLEKMVEAGILYKTYFNGEAAHYEWQDRHHHHLTCNACGYHEKIDSCGYKNYQISPDSNFSNVTNHVVELFGICNSCKV